METTSESKSYSQLIESYTIPSQSTGWSYKKIFAKCLDACEAIVIRDPYIRTRQQIRNLADFLTMVGRESQSKIHVHLITRTATPDEQNYELISEENNKKQVTNLEFLAKAFSGDGKLNVKFSWEIDLSLFSYSKAVSFNNGWRVCSARGFEIWDYRNPDGSINPDLFELPPEQRPTKKCDVKIFQCVDSAIGETDPLESQSTNPDIFPDGESTVPLEPSEYKFLSQYPQVKVYSGEELPTFVRDEFIRLQGATNSHLTPAPDPQQPQPSTMPKQTIYVPKVVVNPIEKIPAITIPETIDNLSLEEIEKLLPQLQASMEASKKRPIQDVVDETFSEEWPEIEGSMQREFEDNLNKDKRNFFLKTSINSILSKSVGEDVAKDFFRTVNHCQETKNFKGTQTFFQKVKGPAFYEVREIAKVSFAVYRLNKRAILGDDYFGKTSSLRETIRDVAKSDSKTVRNVVSQFRQLNLID